MCGILAILNYQGDLSKLRKKALALSKRQRHRGPDWGGCTEFGPTILCHERLAINGVSSGVQPILDTSGKLALTTNGEIYNYKDLYRELDVKSTDLTTGSDCEAIIHVYKKHGNDTPQMLRGQFGFFLFDSTTGQFLAARDRVGIVSLYYGIGSDGSLWFASEMKAFDLGDVRQVRTFPPGHYMCSMDAQPRPYYKPEWWDESRIPPQIDEKDAMEKIRTTLTRAVRSQIMSEVPFGVFLSGGLDSSLIASIICRIMDEPDTPTMSSRAPSHARVHVPAATGASARQPFGLNRLHSFSIGLQGAPDLKAARVMAEYLGTIHHEIHFTIQEALDAVPDVIHHLETFDVTTVRASTPMYLLSRYIKACGVKMVLSGEGSDELLGGYLYFGNAPTAADFHAETVRRVKGLHLSDCLRAHKATLAFGLECRPPFLDEDCLDTFLTIDPELKMHKPGRIEKHILRKAFEGYLPDSVLWRQKEQFSDGVGYSWIDALKGHAESTVTDHQFAQRSIVYPVDTPDTKEAYYIRMLFDEHFGNRDDVVKTVVRWKPRADWGCPEDPSGRAQASHEHKYENRR